MSEMKAVYPQYFDRRYLVCGVCKKPDRIRLLNFSDTKGKSIRICDECIKKLPKQMKIIDLIEYYCKDEGSAIAM